MKIAVTGSSGFLGRYLVRRLVHAGHHLRCWHRPKSDRKGFEDVAAAVEWLPGELGANESAQKLVRGTDALIHAAVQWAGPRNRGSGSHGASEIFWGVNFTGSLQLFQARWRLVSLAACLSPHVQSTI